MTSPAAKQVHEEAQSRLIDSCSLIRTQEILYRRGCLKYACVLDFMKPTVYTS